MKDLWNGYKKALYETFPDLEYDHTWGEWEGKGTNLTAQIWRNKWFIKSRAVDIWSDKTNIYNNIIYPKTGSNLPCFGMDLMGFSPKKVIIVFDFQHPVENLLLEVAGLPEGRGDYRFFEPGNHFSKNIYIAYCEPEKVDEHLPMFRKYLTKYQSMIEFNQPTGTDISVYKDFDTYMTKLDPVGAYLKGKFGEKKAESLVHDFLFCYK
tara:strand:+ start:2870 stop:3493 length:624 start_codon:yes stop_codon:yes gene_type:complete